MSNLSRFEIRVASGKIVSGNPVDGTYMLVAEEPVTKVDENLFVKIEPSKLSFSDKFMLHIPSTIKERRFKDLLTEAINHKVEDFYCSRYAPSFTEDGKSFCFSPGKMPAVGKSYTWWESEARCFKHDRESRLGTKYEYALFLATLMKKMVEEAEDKPACFKDVAAIWDAVCNNSCSLGNYRFNKLLWGVDWYADMQETGLEPVCGFYDLANTYKLLIENEAADSFWLASGSYSDDSSEYPLANIEKTHDHSCFVYNSVGWVVFR